MELVGSGPRPGVNRLKRGRGHAAPLSPPPSKYSDVHVIIVKSGYGVGRSGRSVFSTWSPACEHLNRGPRWRECVPQQHVRYSRAMVRKSKRYGLQERLIRIMCKGHFSEFKNIDINIIIFPGGCNKGKNNPEICMNKTEVHSSNKVHIPRMKTE